VRLSKIAEFVLPGELRTDPVRARPARLVLWLSLFGSVLCAAFSQQQRSMYRSSDAALPLALAAVGFLFTPLILRWTRSPAIAGHAAMTAFAVALGFLSHLRGGLVPTVMMWGAIIPPIVILLSVRGYIHGIAWVFVVVAEIAVLNWLNRSSPVAAVVTSAGGSVGLSALVVATTAIAIGYDLGKRKQQEQQRALEQRLVQAEKLESVGRLAAGIAHDFNNLLTVIRTHTKLLAESVTGEAANQDLATIDKAAERGAELTSQLLAFGRRGILRQETFAIDAVISEVKVLLERVLPESILVSVESTPEIRSVTADKQQIEHVLINLALNARDAMPAGGRLKITVQNCQIEDSDTEPERDLAPGSYVSIDVADEGHGMSPELRARIFEPFFTTKANAGGSGLGLASAYGIVRRAGGTITVDSTLGKGSTFHVYLPAGEARAEAEAASASGTVPSSPPAQATILLVEDEPAVRRATARLLRRHGYVVIAAEDGIRALEMSESHSGPIHLLLTDVVMPRLSGHEVASLISKQRPEVLVAYMSGYSDDPEIARQVAGQRAAFIRKPFEVNDLLKEVDAMLARGSELGGRDSWVRGSARGAPSAAFPSRASRR
jgi:signal transduction histidine kinase/ActR/RegA family two-component response regulator